VPRAAPHAFMLPTTGVFLRLPEGARGPARQARSPGASAAESTLMARGMKAGAPRVLPTRAHIVELANGGFCPWLSPALRAR